LPGWRRAVDTMLAMADDRPRGHAAVGPGEQIVDDDELAAALAAELERIAPTGAVPVLRPPAVPFGPPAAAEGRAPATVVPPREPAAPAAVASHRAPTEAGPARPAADPAPASALAATARRSPVDPVSAADEP